MIELALKLGFKIDLSDLAIHTFKGYGEYIHAKMKKENNIGKENGKVYSLDDLPVGSF